MSRVSVGGPHSTPPPLLKWITWREPPHRITWKSRITFFPHPRPMVPLSQPSISLSRCPNQHVPTTWRRLTLLLHMNMKSPWNLPLQPLSHNVLSDPNLWDGDFGATSLFGTNEFLQSDVRNMACSLQHMASFSFPQAEKP